MTAHQAPPSLGFSRQGHWSGLPFRSPMHESESEVAYSCLPPSDPMDYSLPGFSIHGIFQVRVLEWGAIAFSTPCSKANLLAPGCGDWEYSIYLKGTKKREWATHAQKTELPYDFQERVLKAAFRVRVIGCITVFWWVGGEIIGWYFGNLNHQPSSN